MLYKTDKVMAHRYDAVYERLFAPLRARPAGRFLEIGLGCGMYQNDAAKEGHSLAMWLDYFPPGWAVTTLEYNAACVAAFPALNPFGWSNETWARVALVTGSQAEPADLRRAHDAGGPFDAVVDDGGHSYAMQIASFRTLFPLLAPGGVYIVEDIGPNGLSGRATQQFNDAATTFIAYLDVVLHAVVLGGGNWEAPGATGPFPGRTPGILLGDAEVEALYPGAREIAATVRSVSCATEVCVITKCPAGDVGAGCGRGV